MGSKHVPPAPLAERVEIRPVGIRDKRIYCPCLTEITLDDIEKGYHTACARKITLTVERTI